MIISIMIIFIMLSWLRRNVHLARPGDRLSL